MLFIKDSAGEFRQAKKKEVLEEAIAKLVKEFKAGKAVTKPEDLVDLLRCKLADLKREEFWVCWLDSYCEIIVMECLSIGTFDKGTVHTREVLRSGLEANAAYGIFAHNHPGGNTTPSKADINMTLQLRDALELVCIRLFDHIIVSNAEYTSMSQEGHLIEDEDGDGVYDDRK